MNCTFEAFPKIPRLSDSGAVVTEKLDGTNAQVHITEAGEVLAASRTRYVTPESDNFGFAAWVKANESELRRLGPGRHYGEWWGAGIQRRYDLTEKRFSLFNTARWYDPAVRPVCCHVVPILYAGPFESSKIDQILEELAQTGSIAAPQFMNPEGVVVWHPGSRQLFKKTYEYDATGKGKR